MLQKNLQSQRRTIVYCRESRDDNGENYERIETQRDILHDFCRRQGLTNIIDTVMDDNVSGTKFERFDNIIKMAQKNQVDVLVFKDASRLGRNLRESLNFIHILEECDVEVLFESETYDEAFFPLLAWFNEQRAREDSKKIRRVFKHKMDTGELLIKPTYGYDKVGNQLQINSQAAEVVRQIYDMFLDGYGTCDIATKLNYQGISTPSQTLFAADSRPTCHAWNRQHVYRIITNRVYTGDMVYSKVTKKSFKSNKILRKQVSDWIVVPNHHEAIIAPETFEIVQQKRVKSTQQKKTTKEPRLFSGLLVCGRCGAQLIQRTRKSRKDAYICSKYQKEGCIKVDIRPNYGCETHFLLEDALDAIVAEFCRDLLNSNDDGIEAMLHLQQAKQKREQSHSVIATLEKEVSKLNTIIERIYDDKLNNILPDGLFEKKLKEYLKKLGEAQISLRKAQDKGENQDFPDLAAFRRKLEEFSRADLSNRILKQIFDKIIYFLPNEIKHEHQAKYHIDDGYFATLQAEGGLVFQIANCG